MADLLKKTSVEWDNNIYNWVMIRDCIDGESAVKRQSELYLPMPAAMNLSTAQAPSLQINTSSTTQRNDIHAQLHSTLNPNYHNNAPYMAYKTRSQFPEITSSVLRGLLGMAYSSMPNWDLPTGMEYLEENFTKSGTSLIDFYKYALKQALSVGRLGVLVDIGDDGLPHAVSYVTETIYDWEGVTEADDEFKFKYVKVYEYDGDEEVTLKFLTEDSMFRIDRYEDDNLIQEGDPISFRGATIDVVPFVAIGSTDISIGVDVSPMSGVARTALQIYQMDADLRQGEYMSCNPSLVISGIDEEFAPKAIGSTMAIILPPDQAKAYYPATDTSALKHCSDRVERLSDKAVEQGVALIGSGQKESGDALKIRQGTKNATLASCVNSVAKGIEQTLKYMAILHKKDPSTVKFEGNTEFGAMRLNPQEQQALVASWVAGAMSKSTMLDNFRRGGLLQEGDTVEDQIDRIDDEAPDEDFNTGFGLEDNLGEGGDQTAGANVGKPEED